MLLTILGALIIGLSLGLLGSGGSILTVPLLTYIIGEPAKVAIAESLLIVGGIALIGAIKYQFQGLINWSRVWAFGAPSMVGTYGGAVMSQYVSGVTQLAVFAVIMLLASRFMLKPISPRSDSVGSVAIPTVMLIGTVVGAIAGFVGVGGGFLIVPALLLTGTVAMTQAIATSLSIIVLQSLVGFSKYAWLFAKDPSLQINYSLIAIMVTVGALGSLAGVHVGGKLPQAKLKQGFGALLIVMGSGIFLSSLWQLVG